MNEIEVIERVQEIFRAILALSARQREAYQSLHLSGSGLYVPKVLHEGWVMKKPKVYQSILLQAFWTAYREVADGIESPIVGFAIRPLLELSFGRTIFFGELTDEKEREAIALKDHLLSLAFSVSRGNHPELRKQYDVLLPFLPLPDRKAYERLRTNGFPLREISDRLHHLHPSPRSERVVSLVKKYWLNVYGNPIEKQAIETLYLIYSGFVHPYAYHMTSFEEQAKDKTHLYRSVSLLVLFGISVLIFGNTLTQNAVTEEEIQNLRAEAQSLQPLLLRYSSYGRKQEAAARTTSAKHAEQLRE